MQQSLLVFDKHLSLCLLRFGGVSLSFDFSGMLFNVCEACPAKRYPARSYHSLKLKLILNLTMSVRIQALAEDGALEAVPLQSTGLARGLITNKMLACEGAWDLR